MGYDTPNIDSIENGGTLPFSRQIGAALARA